MREEFVGATLLLMTIAVMCFLSNAEIAIVVLSFALALLSFVLVRIARERVIVFPYWIFLIVEVSRIVLATYVLWSYYAAILLIIMDIIMNVISYPENLDIINDLTNIITRVLILTYIADFFYHTVMVVLISIYTLSFFISLTRKFSFVGVSCDNFIFAVAWLTDMVQSAPTLILTLQSVMNGITLGKKLRKRLERVE